MMIWLHEVKWPGGWTGAVLGHASDDECGIEGTNTHAQQTCSRKEGARARMAPGVEGNSSTFVVQMSSGRPFDWPILPVPFSCLVG
jgi:hypothetical protein